MTRLGLSWLVVLVTVLLGSTSVGAAGPSQPSDPNKTITVGSGPIAVAVNPKTDTIYVVNRGSNSVSVINGATNTVTATITVGSSPEGVAVNPTTDTSYVTNFNDGTVSVINGA